MGIYLAHLIPQILLDRNDRDKKRLYKYAEGMVAIASRNMYDLTYNLYKLYVF